MLGNNGKIEECWRSKF